MPEKPSRAGSTSAANNNSRWTVLVGHIGKSQQAALVTAVCVCARDSAQPPSIVFVYSYLPLPTRARSFA